MVVIQSAKFGDEFSSTDVLKSLQDTLKEKGELNVNVDSSLIPVLDKALGAGVSLTGPEQDEIKQTAAEMCGAADQICLEMKTQELAAAKLKEKETSDVNAANIIKGRRLTVSYTDEKGQSRTAVIPEGQKFQVGANAGKADAAFDYKAVADEYKSKALSMWVIVGTPILIFFYVSSIVITWMTFIELSSKLMAAGMTAIAVFVPYSGFALSVFSTMIWSYLKSERISRTKPVGENLS